MSEPHRVLIVDDDELLAATIASVLEEAGYSTARAPDSGTALAEVRREPADLALVDLRLGSESGIDLLERLKALDPEMSVIVITALATIETAVEAMRRGADNFIPKPVEPDRLLAFVEKGIEAGSLRRQRGRLERLSERGAARILGRSAAMRDALALAEAVAARDTTVLLLGETGTGKGLVARHIHESSPRRKRPFVELNCAGMPRELTESELFGHEKGAFTGAAERKLGLFEAAHGGTLFLDEIGEMDPAVQSKLLKVLEERRFRRLGGVTEISVDTRLVAATHRDLARDVRDGRFREDLYYRLNVFAIRMAPLRERREDVLPLARFFLCEFRGVPDQGQELLAPEAARLLEEHAWPGNVRELRNVIERATILCRTGEIVQASHLLPLRPAAPAAAAPDAPPGGTIHDAERRAIEEALQRHGGEIRAAARDLGIARTTLYRKLRRYGIPIDEARDPED
jgi:DNA-binding NtrC family response regulator